MHEAGCAAICVKMYQKVYSWIHRCLIATL